MVVVHAGDCAALALSDRIRFRIAQEGPLSFADFMGMALYDPQGGYYNQRALPMTADGDFVTAPEISPLFARAWVPSFQKMVAAGMPPVIVELGPGTGAWARHFLEALHAEGIAWESYHLIETSAALRQVQQRTLWGIPGLRKSRLQWHTQLDFPVSGMVIANEFIDAFPVYVIEKVDRYWQECRVTATPQGFEWVHAPLEKAEQKLQQFVRRLEPLLHDCPSGYRAEIPVPAHNWLHAAWPWVHSGLVFWVDYGYPRSELYHVQRSAGTLSAYLRHQRSADVLSQPGTQDLTAFVDFSAWSEALLQHDWHTIFFSSQAEFLLSQGILERADPHNQDQLRAIKSLTLDMGQTFQVLCAAKGVDLHRLQYPELRDRAGRL